MSRELEALKAEGPFTYRREMTFVSEKETYVIRSRDEIWVAIVPIERWAIAIVEALSKESPLG